MILSSLLLLQDMIQYFDQVASLVLKSLDDLNPRVLWATMQAINCLSEYKDQLMLAEYHMKLLAKLVPISICNSCACLQVQIHYAALYCIQLIDSSYIAYSHTQIASRLHVCGLHERS